MSQHGNSKVMLSNEEVHPIPSRESLVSSRDILEYQHDDHPAHVWAWQGREGGNHAIQPETSNICHPTHPPLTHQSETLLLNDQLTVNDGHVAVAAPADSFTSPSIYSPGCREPLSLHTVEYHSRKITIT